VRQAVTLLLHRPQLAQGVPRKPEWRALEVPGMDLLLALLEFLRARPHVSTGAILEHWRERPEGQALARLAATPPGVPEDGLEAEFSGALARLREQWIDRRTQALLELSHRRALDEAEKSELKQLLAQRSPGCGEAGGGRAD